ncbi:MAG: MBL fold metallo-hydrolase [Chloroflexi bacterium]|nr:MBL fold metallo-hydrolase [Chloroflexota bacterium]
MPSPPSHLHLLSLPTPFPVGAVNVYLAEGDPLTLIDAGPKDEPARAALEDGLAAHGHRVEDIRRIVLTHHHVDHIGLAAEIVARSGAEVLTHPYNLPWLEDYVGARIRNAPFYNQIWDEGGVPEQIVEMMARASEGVAQWLDPLTGANTIDEGDTLAFADREWRVHHTPGHAGGLICLWEPLSRTLLSNDHLLRDISSNPVMEPPVGQGPRPKRLVEYLREMRRMAGLDPAIALPGHGEAIHDVPGLVRKRIAFHRRRAEKILATLDGERLTLWELTRPLFPRLSTGMDFFLALSEIQGHLDLLAESGEVEPTGADGLLRWKHRPMSKRRG